MGDEIRIVRGKPTDEELAALVAVLVARTPDSIGASQPVSRWAASARPRHRQLPRGADAWRSSGRRR